MNPLSLALLFGLAFLGVFLGAAWSGPARLLGANLDIMPALMLYAGIHGAPWVFAALAVAGGLGADSLSANPAGVSVLPLFAIGLAAHARRAVILHEEWTAQMVLGLGAGAFAPLATLLLLYTLGAEPIIRWGSIWQWGIVALCGALATLLVFRLLAWMRRQLAYGHVPDPTFRPDRELERGRS
jgi:cell shape-determining protein MreD